MSASGNRTVDRIQQEIQESIEREKELRNKYNQLNNINNNNNAMNKTNGEVVKTNGYVNNNINNKKVDKSASFANVALQAMRANQPPAKNGTRLFTQNSSTRGVMQKFYQMRGKLNSVNSLKQPPQQRTTSPNWIQGDVVAPPVVTIEPGRDLRNGFVSAKEKMERELQEFRQREQELRNERRKSQPNLMAALELEDEEDTHTYPRTRSLQAAYSVTSLNNDEEWDSSSYSSASITNNNNNNSSNLKRSQSLAALCAFSDDEELDVPGTHSLIMQFESLNRAQY